MLKPLHDNIVIRRDRSKEKEGRIIIPDQAKRKSQTGEVVAVGPGRYVKGEWVPTSLKAGDRVVFKNYGWHDIEYKGEELIVMAEVDVLGRV